MVSRRLDAFLVTGQSNVRYLTGFSGSNGLCLVTGRAAVFMTDSRYTTQVRDEVIGWRIVIASTGMFQAAADRHLLPARVRVGIEEQHLTVAELRNLRRLFPGVRFVPVSLLVESIAAVKDEDEISLIRNAVGITDAVFAAILPLIKPGVRERDVAAEISALHRRYGAEGDAFDPIVASGPRGALPHARPTARKFRRGEMITLDLGCRVQGYHSDLTRTVALGRPSPTMKKIYAIVHDAQQRAIDAAHSGMAACDLDAVARRAIRRNGYGRFFIHALGHGLGLHVHDPLRVSARSTEILREGFVLTIEPGIYLPGIGGVRIEDDVVIRRDGCAVLNRAPKDLLTV